MLREYRIAVIVSQGQPWQHRLLLAKLENGFSSTLLLLRCYRFQLLSFIGVAMRHHEGSTEMLFIGIWESIGFALWIKQELCVMGMDKMVIE